MAKANLKVTLDWKNLAIGVAFVLVAMVIFRLALPAVMPADMVLAIASVIAGVLAWYLFLVSRSGAE